MQTLSITALSIATLSVLAGRVAAEEKTDYVFYPTWNCHGDAIETKNGLPVGTCRGVPTNAKAVAIYTNGKKQNFELYNNNPSHTCTKDAEWRNVNVGSDASGPFCFDLTFSDVDKLGLFFIKRTS